MTKSLQIIAVLVSMVGCVDKFNLEGRPCPCVDGWVCDGATNRCVEAVVPSTTTTGEEDAGLDRTEVDGGSAADGSQDSMRDGGVGRDDAGIVPVGCQNRFCLVHPRSQTELTDLWVLGPNEIIAVGDDGLILHYDGVKLTRAASPYSGRYSSIWGIPGHFYASGSVGGNVMHQAIGGWSLLPSINTASLEDVWADAPDNVYAVGRLGVRGVINHYDGAVMREIVSLENVFTELHSIWGSATDDIFAAGNNGTLLHFDGNAWSPITSPTSARIERIVGWDANNILLATERELFRSEGSNWLSALHPAGAFLYDMWMRSADEFYTINSDHRPFTEIYRSQNGVFEKIFHIGDAGDTASDETHLNRIRGWLAGEELYAVGKNGAIHFYDGNSWHELSYGSGPLVNATYKAVWCRGPSEAWAVADYGSIVRYDGNGWRQVFPSTVASLRKWNALHSTTTEGWHGIWGDGASGELFLVGGTTVSAMLWHYNGAEWFDVSIDSAPPLRAVWGFHESQVVAVGAGGTALHYDGTNWQPYASGTGTTRDLVSIWGTSMENLYAVARDDTDSIIIHYDGTLWSPIPATQVPGLNAISGSSANNIYAVGDAGLVLRFNGTSWNALAVPTTEPLRTVWVGDTDDVVVAGGEATYLHYDGDGWREIASEAGSQPQHIDACSGNLFFVAGYNEPMQSAGVLSMSR